jgi:hypothetical protein
MTLVLAMLAITACGKQSSGPQTGDVASCDLPGSGNCRQYNAANLAAGSDNLAKLCSIAKTATFAMRACPTANLTGSCAQKEHTDYYYASYPIPAEELEMACRTQGGTFTKAASQP